ncbi:MAG: lipoate--protein ligase [Synergistaceae bacterium]|nr:lipoate--protein ligase [Synergistaceae bacterium]
MRLVINENTSPHFNLALEEYFLTCTDIEVVMLWRNSASVIIGRNQNTQEEVNLDYVREQNIPVVRRLSGGGAVFHDLGNVNYTIIRAVHSGDFNNYEYFTRPVIEYLRTLGVNAELQGRNDLTIGGAKFCGNAQTVRGGRVLHHGCILYNADFSNLAGALAPRDIKFASHGVKSIRKRVTNITEYLDAPMTVEHFLDGLCRYFAEHIEDIEPYSLSPGDTATARRLAAEKYSSWEWNFGASPPYNMKRSRRYDFGLIDLLMSVERGEIREAHIYGDFFGVRDKEELEELLTHVRHDRESVMSALRGADIGEYIRGMEMADFVDLIC